MQLKSINYIINWTQVLNWTIVSALVVFYIFFLNSPDWFTVVKAGFVIQFILVITSLFSGKSKFLFKWFVFDSIAMVILGLMELENNGIISLAKGEDDIQLGLLIIALVNLMFGVSIAFILKRFTNKR
jgi:hypothetical protein